MSELLGSIARSPVKLLRLVYSIRDRRSRRHPEPPTRTSASSTSADERAALNGQRADPAAAQHVRTDNLLEFCVDLRLQRRARPVSSSGRGIPARADDGDLLVEDDVHLSPPFHSCYGRLQQADTLWRGTHARMREGMCSDGPPLEAQPRFSNIKERIVTRLSLGTFPCYEYLQPSAMTRSDDLLRRARTISGGNSSNGHRP